MGEVTDKLLRGKKKTILLESSHTSPSRPSHKGSVKVELIYIILKNSHKANCVSITKANQLKLFRKMIPVCSEDNKKHMNKSVGKIQRHLLLKQEIYIVTAVS
jgi:hypothetical protein